MRTKFKDIYLSEDVDAQSKAYWLAPSRKIIPVMMTHIDTVLKAPKEFGIDQEYINKKAEENGGVQELRDGGKARDAIMIDLLKKGWVRIRKVDARQSQYWTIQLENGMGTQISSEMKRNIKNWAEKMINMNPARANDAVVVLNTKGAKLFGGGMLVKDQKSIQDILMDDTGVFEGIFFNKELV